MEEWIPPYAIESAASEFKDHGYTLLVVLGNERRWVIPILKEAGVDERQIVKIPVPPVVKDSTFALAVALKNWLLASGMPGKAVNVYTVGVHARRSWLLCRKALGPGFTVGVIHARTPTMILNSGGNRAKASKQSSMRPLLTSTLRLFFYRLRQ